MTADRHAARRAVALLAAVVLMFVAAFTLGSSPAVADTGSLAGTRVAAFDLADADGVGPITDISPGEGRETAAGSYDSALGCCVATRAPGGGALDRLHASGRLTGDAGSTRVPNPWGKLGSPQHRAVVDDVAADIQARGLTPRPEVRIPTPGGHKGTRFADMGAFDDAGNLVEIHQVGRVTQGGVPVIRERKAISDLIQNIDPSVGTYYHPYVP